MAQVAGASRIAYVDRYVGSAAGALARAVTHGEPGLQDRFGRMAEGG
ncbi:hypothetical protein [Streptomyces fragilis]|uniref:Uncharacterized protein n=1 Tax=Streptomyces fragilis TaxID=67301 RepID=A0ABV2YF26_9ACTN|nr:hypothetical protein [Streptomyces fragilis]